MSNTKEVKISIRKRLFFSALARGELGEKYGFKLCLRCRGEGAICVEYRDGESRYAAYVMAKKSYLCLMISNL